MASSASWTPEDIRNKAKSWNLEGDAKLLELMQNISGNLLNRAKQTANNVNKMTISLEKSSIALDNTANKLSALSQKQFVENRVYDDDEAISRLRDVPFVEENKKPYNPIETIKTIMKNNMDMLENCYEKVSVDLGDSDEEDEQNKSMIVYRPKNPYNRPLPALIGSKEWREKWHIGLMDTDDENSDKDQDRQEEFSDDSESISLASNGPTISESGSSVWSVNRNSSRTLPQTNRGMKYSVSSDEEEISSNTLASKTSSDDARRSGIISQIPPPPPPEQRYYVHKPIEKPLFDSTDSEEDNKKTKQPKPMPRMQQPIQKKQEISKISNIFNDEPPELDQTEQKETSKGQTKLFFDSDEDEIPVRTLENQNEIKSTTSNNLRKKTVNLFDDNDFDSFMQELDKKTVEKFADVQDKSSKKVNLFDESSEDETKTIIADTKSAQNISGIAQSNVNVNKKELKITQKVEVFDKKKVSLFEDSDENDDLFSTTKTIKNDKSTISSNNSLLSKTKITNLFDDEPPDDDFDTLFNPSISTKNKEIPTSINSQKESKIPNLFLDSPSDNDKTFNNSIQSNPISENNAQLDNIFKNDEIFNEPNLDFENDNSLFSKSEDSNAQISNTTKNNKSGETNPSISRKPIISSKIVPNLFSDELSDDDDLFGSKTIKRKDDSKANAISKNGAKVISAQNSEFLFNDIESSGVISNNQEINDDKHDKRNTITYDSHSEPVSDFDSFSSNKNYDDVSQIESNNLIDKNEKLIEEVVNSLNKKDSKNNGNELNSAVNIFSEEAHTNENSFERNILNVKEIENHTVPSQVSAIISDEIKSELINKKENLKFFEDDLTDHTLIHPFKTSDNKYDKSAELNVVVNKSDNNKPSEGGSDLFRTKTVQNYERDTNDSKNAKYNSIDEQNVPENIISNSKSTDEVKNISNDEYKIKIQDSKNDENESVISSNSQSTEVVNDTQKSFDLESSNSFENISNEQNEDISITYDEQTNLSFNKNETKSEDDTKILQQSSQFNASLFDDSPPEDEELFTKPIQNDCLEEYSPLNSSKSNSYSAERLNPYTNNHIVLFDDIPPDDFVDDKKLPENNYNEVFDDLTDNVSPKENYIINNEPPSDNFYKDNNNLVNEVESNNNNEVKQSLLVSDKLPKHVESNIYKTSVSELIKKNSAEIQDSRIQKPLLVAPKKLNTNLNINVAALLPGAKRMLSIKNQDETDQFAILKTNEIKPENVSSEISKSENYSSSSDPSKLVGLNKTRAKHLVKRKPSTRDARKENYRKSLLDSDSVNENNLEDSQNSVETDQNLPKNVEISQKSYLEDKNSSATENKNSLNEIIKPKTSKLFSSDSDTESSDWLNPTAKTRSTEKPKEFTSNIQENSDISKVGLFSNIKSDDIYTIPSNQVPEHTVVKRNLEYVKALSKAPPLPLYGPSDSDDDDLFNSKISAPIAKSLQSQVQKSLDISSKIKTHNVNIDDEHEIFKKVKIKKPPTVSSSSIIKSEKENIKKPVQQKSSGLFSSDEDDDELFSGNRNKKVNTTKTTLKSEKKEKIEKKILTLAKTAGSLFDDIGNDDDDDIFGSSKPNKPVETSSKSSTSQPNRGAIPKRPLEKKVISSQSQNVNTDYNPLADLLEN